MKADEKSPIIKAVRWYKLDGKIPVPDETNGTWLCREDNNLKRQVARTTVFPGVEVSTVFLCLDHGWGDTVLLFETLVFGGPMDGEMNRYETWEEAEAGHKEMIAKVIENK